MSLASIPGKMAVCMKASTRKIRSTASASIPGLIRSAMQAGGVMANSMDSESSRLKRAENDWVFGRMEKSSNGLQVMKLQPLRSAI